MALLWCCSFQPTLEWSPTGRHLLYIEPYDVAVYKVDGTRYKLPGPESDTRDDLTDVCASWSPSGRYVVLHMHSEDGYTLEGRLWDIDTEQVVLRWQIEDTENLSQGLAKFPVLWAKGDTFLLTACSMLIKISLDKPSTDTPSADEVCEDESKTGILSKKDKAKITAVPLDRAVLRHQKLRMKFSPGGSLLVGCRCSHVNYSTNASLCVGPFKEATDTNDKAWNASRRSKYPYLLWHAVVDMTKPFCGTIVVQVGSSSITGSVFVFGILKAVNLTKNPGHLWTGLSTCACFGMLLWTWDSPSVRSSWSNSGPDPMGVNPLNNLYLTMTV